jgi:hypothetical protein
LVVQEKGREARERSCLGERQSGDEDGKEGMEMEMETREREGGK